MLVKYCTKCGKVMTYTGNPLCEECYKEYLKHKQEYRKAAKRAKDKIYNQKYRNRKSDKFYHSKTWKDLSKIVLARSGYVCAECGELATEVHHKKEISTHWENRFDLDNLEPLCTSCHNRRRAKKDKQIEDDK